MARSFGRIGPVPRRGRAGVVRSVAALLIGGCAAANMERAPSVTGATIDAGAARGYVADDIQWGREVFIARCAECHTLQAPAGHSDEQWREILPRMARRARLDEDDRRRVETYIFAARGAGPNGGGSAK
jgi:mono/diheme cytochrome c family protein